MSAERVPVPALAELLMRHAEVVEGLVRHEARGLLRFEAVEDLVQGVHQRALEHAEGFEWQGEQAFVGWLRTLARNWLHRRRAHWSALKRDGGALLRLTLSDSAGQPGGDPASPLPADTLTGPATLADRLEQVALATRALDLLYERDRKLVVWTTQSLSLEEMAKRLEISYSATERARLRALERLRKAYDLVTRR